jgi:hypothetical protein
MRGRHAELERMLSGIVEGGCNEAIHIQSLLVRSRLLGGEGMERARDTRISDSTVSGGLDVAARAEQACWSGWIHAWPLSPTFQPATAAEWFRRSVALSALANRPSARCWSYVGAALLYNTLRASRLSEACLDRAASDAWVNVDAEAAVCVAGLRALNALQVSDPVSARHWQHAFSRLARKLDHVLYDVRALVLEARLALEGDDDLDLAVDSARSALTLLEEATVDDRLLALEASLVLHDAALRAGERAAALAQLDTIDEAWLDVIGARQRIGQRRQIHAGRALVHEMPRRAVTGTNRHRSLDLTGEPFWTNVPDLGDVIFNHPILVIGEPGTGKFHAASQLHDAYRSDEAELIVVECDASSTGPMNKARLEHGAVDDRTATIILRHIDRISREMAERVHALLTERFGDGRTSMGIVIATTSAPLSECVAEGRFPDALYQAFGTVVIERPPLRRVPTVTESLVWHFVNRYSDVGQTTPGVTEPALEALRRYHWPGNVRQLRNEIHRIVTAIGNEPAPVIDVADLSDHITGQNHLSDAGSTALDSALAATERQIIAAVLARHGGQVSSAADELGLTRQGLYKKMKRLAIDARRTPERAEAAVLGT